MSMRGRLRREDQAAFASRLDKAVAVVGEVATDLENHNPHDDRAARLRVVLPTLEQGRRKLDPT